MMLQMKFDNDRPAELRDIDVWMCGRMDAQTHGQIDAGSSPNYKLPWALGSGELKNGLKTISPNSP